MGYTIIQNFIRKNRSYTPLNAKGTVVHETATPGASDEDEQSYFNNNDVSASAHAFVDWDSITQTIPWNEQAWHAGNTANQNYIGIELCNYNDANKFQEIWNRAVWLFAYVHVNILKVTTINKDNLMSHAEVSNRWHETDHLDPIDYFAKFGKTVDDFRNAVQVEIYNMINPANISYQAHIQDIGWQNFVRNGEIAGTEGKSLRMEALAVNYEGPGNIIIDAHVKDIGWQAPRKNGEIVGTVRKALRIEAIKIRLENAPGLHVEYQVHVQDKGWQPWVRDGAIAGTVGESRRLEAIKIRIVRE